MKIEWKINKKIWIASGIVLAVFLALGVNSKANIFAVFAGAAAFFVICSVKLTLPEKLEKWKDWKLLWAALILFLSALFTQRQVQYLLVEPGNRGKLSDTECMAECVLLSYRSAGGICHHGKREMVCDHRLARAYDSGIYQLLRISVPRK